MLKVSDIPEQVIRVIAGAYHRRTRFLTRAYLILILYGIAFLLWVALASLSCHARWDRIFRTTWGPVQGCMIEPSPGVWIPADNYREVK